MTYLGFLRVSAPISFGRVLRQLHLFVVHCELDLLAAIVANCYIRPFEESVYSYCITLVQDNSFPVLWLIIMAVIKVSLCSPKYC